MGRASIKVTLTLTLFSRERWVKTIGILTISGLAFLPFWSLAQGGTNNISMVPVGAGNCLILVPEFAVGNNDTTYVWNGGCKKEFAEGKGILRRYEEGTLIAISKYEFQRGLSKGNTEMYSYPKNGKVGFNLYKQGVEQMSSNISPSQVPEWAREIVDGRPRQSTPANLASQQPSQNSVSASPTAPASKTTSKTSSPVSSARSRLFVAYSEEVARPFLVSGEAMLPNVVSSYINRRTADYSQQGGPPRMRTEECHPGAGAGPYFAFIQYHLSGMPIGGLRTGWGVACGANSPDEAVRASQRACESRSSYCRVQRGLDKENQVELIIGDMRTQGEPRVIENFSVRLKESRPDGGADVGDVINYDDTWHNIPEGFVCRWNSTWGDRHRNFLIHANGPFIKKQVGFRSQYLIDFRCSSFLPLY